MDEYHQIPNTKYEINKLGQVRRIYKNGNICILKPCICKNGYYMVTFTENGKGKSYTIHRLLAQQFIPNPNNLPFVDHINRNKQDNTLDNLRWVTISDNNSNREKKGCVYQTKDKVKGKIYIGYRAAYYNNKKKIEKRFKLKEDAEKWLNENIILI